MKQEKKIISYESHEKGTYLKQDQFLLLQAAVQAAKNAYAPYSKFYVGAAILMENGKIITGNNQENASYPCGICAERTALYSVNGQYPNTKILKLAVSILNEDTDHSYPPSPCGICRQVMNEFEIQNQAAIELILGHPDRITFVFDSCNSILPFSFNPDFLQH